MKSILIVDDIKVNLKVLEVLLTRNGYNTTSALSGKDALSLLQIKSIDLIISDILMPEMDGFQFCRLCKLDENLKHIPIIFYSSTHTEATARKLAKKVGATAFITKPADPAMLLKTIDTILDDHGSGPSDHEGFISKEPEKAYHEPETKDQHISHTNIAQDHQTLLKNIPCAVWTMDIKGEIAYISSAVEKITGFTATHLTQKGKRQWLTRVHPRHVEKVRTAYKNLYRSHIPLDIEYLFECRDGELIWLHEKSGLPYTKKGLRYVDGVSIDISEKKYLQTHEMKSREHRIIQTLTGGIAHDLSTLLTGITGYIELSRMDDTSPSERQTFLTKALDISTRASALNRQFFTLSNNRKPATRTGRLSEVMTAATSRVLADNDVEIKVDIPSDLWPCQVEPTPMAQAMENLLLNAQEALTANGFIEVILQNLSIKKREFIADIVLNPGNYIKTTIRDNGYGIDSDHLPLVRIPYFTTRTRGTTQGLGLGLSITEAIITQHGGVMVITSRKDAGTTMDIYLPALNPEKNTNENADPIPSSQAMKLLIMDADDMVRDITCQILERSGFKVTCVKTGAETLSRYRQSMASDAPFNAVILDIMVQDDSMTGLTTLEQIKKIHPDVLAVASSANPEDPIITQYTQYGFHATLSKPYVADDLVTTIKTLLSSQIQTA